MSDTDKRNSTPHFYIKLQNLSITHSVSSVTFSANLPDSISLDNFTDISLKPLEISQPYGAHIHTKDMNSSFTLTFTGDDGKICTFTTIGHNPPSQSGEGCVGANVISNDQTLIFQVDAI